MDEYPARPHSLYELAFPAPKVSEPEDTGPVLIHALDGFADAGHAVTLAATHLRDSLDSQLVATFATDELMDYRSRRPTISFSGEAFTDIEMPRLTLHAIRDTTGRGFLLLSGAEPDMRWEQFVAAVRTLAERFGVTDIIGLNAVPMAAPHTRAPSLTAHGTDTDFLNSLPRWNNTMKLPASASMLLELRLGEHGHRTSGLSVHVPHYLSQADYPAASARLLRTIAELTGLELPVAALDAAAEKVRLQVDKEVANNAEIESVVTALEGQYDAYTAAEANQASLLAADEPLPSGDELGAELERFLAEQATQAGSPEPGTQGGSPELGTESGSSSEGPDTDGSEPPIGG